MRHEVRTAWGGKRPRHHRRRACDVLCPSPGRVSRVMTLRSAMSAFLDGVADAAVAATARRPSRWAGLPAAPALGRAAQEFMLRRSITLRELLHTVLLPAVEAALDFERLFSGWTAVSGWSVAVNAAHAAFTRRQVWCLVANMFFCTFAPRVEAAWAEEVGERRDGDADMVEAHLLPTCDYAEMVAAPDGANGVEVTKLLLLFDYLAAAASWTEEEGAEQEMSVHRCRAAPELARALLPKEWRRAGGAAPGVELPALRPPVLHALGESIDDQHAMIRLDFANRWIGGGALSSGAVQEEITFAQCPPLNTLRWNHSRLGHAESLVVTDYRQYGRIAIGTYGGGIGYGEAVCPPLRCGGALLAVDALDFRFETVDECSAAAVYREVMKLVGGLSSTAVRDIACVAGGNWGCGVFGGDYELKFLIQWVACGIAGKTLHYFPFDTDTFAAFIPRVAERLATRCTPPLSTAHLLSFLYDLEDASDSDDDDDDGEKEKEKKKDTFGYVWRAFLQHFQPTPAA